LFAGVESAGSEALDVPMTSPALPQAGTSAYSDDRLTGARNENSVLFSLDSLKVANPSQPPDPQKRLTNEDPFGMGAPAGITGLGGGNALFTLADNQRLLSAPPPPPEPPPRAVEAVASHPVSIHPALAGRKALWIAGGGLLLVLLLGVGIGAALGGGKETPEVASATAPSSSPESEKTPEKSEEPAKTAEAETTATASAPAPPASAEKPEEKAAANEKSGTEQGKSGSKKDSKKEESTPAPATDQPFNRGAAVAAMSAAASAAAGCKKPGGPTGSGKVSITFAPTGRVTAATVDTAPFAGTAVGGCVAGVFRRAKVPPFTGSSIRVSKSFTIP
jgi:hypothetical protein